MMASGMLVNGMASGMLANDGEWNVGEMMASGMLANDGEARVECWQMMASGVECWRMMASGMLANEWNVGE